MSQWSLVRVELARTPEFPDGSASRGYLMRVPLDHDGRVDETEVSRNPQMATVRRFWPGEADQSGYLVRKGLGWAFSYALGEEDDEDLHHLEAHPLRLGEYVTLTEPDGERLPFRVMRSEADGAGIA